MDHEIWVRPLEKDDIPFMHKLYNQKSIMDYWFLEAYYPQDRITSGYEQMKESDRHRRFVICKGDENIGLTGLYDIEPIHRNTEFGIMMDPAYQGKGYATKVTEMMADYAFRILNLHKVHLVVAKENKKAIHIYEKIGYHIEGEMKEHFYINGSYQDAYMMAIFQAEWDNNA